MYICQCVKFWYSRWVLSWRKSFSCHIVNAVSIIEQSFDNISNFCYCRGYYRCFKTFIEILVEDFLLTFLYFLSSIYYDSCGAFVRSFEVKLFVRGKGFPLLCWKVLFSTWKVMEAISNFVRSRYLTSATDGCAGVCQFVFNLERVGLPCRVSNYIYCKPL